MRDPIVEGKRLALIEAAATAALRLAVGITEPVEDLVVVLADEGDANARVLLKALGLQCEAGQRAEQHASLAAFRRETVVRILEPLDPEAANALRTPTPMKLTVLVVAYGGWSVTGLGRNVGSA